MTFTFAHNNLNVLNLERSLAFYKEALHLTETRRVDKTDFTLVFLGDGKTPHKLELTWLKDRTVEYDLGDNEVHIAFTTDAFDQAHTLHQQMGCICYENSAWGYTLLPIRTDIGLRFCLTSDKFLIHASGRSRSAVH